jgi:Chaperone of endosialidase
VLYTADAYRKDGKRFTVIADEKLTAFLEIPAFWQNFTLLQPVNSSTRLCSLPEVLRELRPPISGETIRRNENQQNQRRNAVPLCTSMPMKAKIQLFLITLLIACLEPSQNAHAVTPPPDGGYPGGNTAEGDNALLSLTSGSYDTALGFRSLEKNTGGNFNTAVGALALFINTTGIENTATGAGALLRNASPFQIGGNGNTANGAFALFENNSGSLNTAIGDRALFSNTASSNTAIGSSALANSTTGNGNIALGSSAGSNVTTASNVICIGSGGGNNSNRCFIGGIFGTSSPGGASVFINSGGQLSAPGSSRRFKEDIKPMERASEVLYALKPVTFHYKKEIDPQEIPQFGLVAEEVEKVNPDLIVRDKEGKPYSVCYDQVNAMLLNEFLKEHEKTEKLEATVATLIATVKEQASQIQKVSAQLGASKPATQVVNNR